MFGEKNLHELVRAGAHYDVEGFAGSIIDTIKKWFNTDEEVFSDDVTLIAVDIHRLPGSF